MPPSAAEPIESRATKQPTPRRPEWHYGDGASGQTWKDRKFLTIDPHEDGRTLKDNYKLVTTTTVPRPIALVSTVSADGKSLNLAPFSFFKRLCQILQPPIYSLSLIGDLAKDTVKNILATGELCVSMTSDWICEAANFSSVNAPKGVSEWHLSGLTPKSSTVVRPPHVAESPFSMECKLHHHHKIFNPSTGKQTAEVILFEAVKYHIWEDAIGEDRATADIDVLRPVFRAGGTFYGGCQDYFELPRPSNFKVLEKRPSFQKFMEKEEAHDGCSQQNGEVRQTS